MDAVEIARWQFGITTVYHFLMVPLTLGLGVTTAALQTVWYKTGKPEYKRMTKFWGKLFLINFIVGVATGLVQEFQFGMAWSEYSKFVGDVFGAPLAMEALLAFFLESTFLGLWIFGWDRLPKKLHLASIWCAGIGTWLSAYFIIVANSWMQHPVGVEMVDGRPVMTDIFAVLTNNTAVLAFAHTITGALSVAGSFLLGIAWYHLWRRRTDGIDSVGTDGKVIVGEHLASGRDKTDHRVWIKSARIGAVIAMAAFAGVAVTGDLQAKLMFQQQPMKMAAAEAACHDGTGFSVLSINPIGSSQSCDKVDAVVEIPGLLSFLATGDFTTNVKGVNTLVPEYEAKYGTHLPNNPIYGEHAGEKIEYIPLMYVTYWGFRIMITFGAIAALVAFIAWFILRKGTVPESKWLMRAAILSILAPFGANSAGWVFTEMGRQPFVVAPNPSGADPVFMYTAAAVSPGVAAWELLTSLIVLTLVYGVLAVIEVKLLVKFVRGGVPSAMPELLENPSESDSADQDKRDVLAFAY